MEISPRNLSRDRVLPCPPTGLAERWGFKSTMACAVIAVAAAITPADAIGAPKKTASLADLGKPQVREIANKRGLPKAVEDYRAARLDRGCLVEAMVFADWFMTQNFDGKKTAAQIVEVNARMGDRTQAHAMVIFSHEEKFYAWDMNYGAQPLDIKGSRSMAEAAQRQFERMFDNDLATASTGIGDLNKQKSVPLPSNTNPLDVAAQRLNETRPLLMIDVKKNGQTEHGLATIFEGELYVFSPDRGALSGGKITGETLMSSLTKTVGRVFGDNAGFAITKQLAPRT